MIDKNKIIEAYQFRHACKLFDPEKIISDEDIYFILETARLSPSSLGLEPWHFVVVQNRDLRNKLKENAWGATAKLDTASHFILGLTMKSSLMRYDSPYVAEFMKNVQHHPDKIAIMRRNMMKDLQLRDFDLTDERKIFDWASKQCYIALGNMITSAAMIGIDSCPIEGFNIKTTERILKEEFDIDIEKYGISYMVAFGYRVKEPGIKTRRSLDEIVTWKK